MLAGCMEYAKPKALLSGFAESTLVLLLKKFMPELFPAESEANSDGIPASLSQKILPDHYYSFKHRRVYAKVRRMGYFVVDAQRLYEGLLVDELRHYQMHDSLPVEQAPVDYDQIKLDSVLVASSAAKETTDDLLAQHQSQPILEVLKTISGLSKVHLVRLDTARAEQGFSYQIQIVRKVSGLDTVVGVVRPMHELANIYLAKDIEDVRCGQLC